MVLAFEGQYRIAVINRLPRFGAQSFAVDDFRNNLAILVFGEANPDFGKPFRQFNSKVRMFSRFSIKCGRDYLLVLSRIPGPGWNFTLSLFSSSLIFDDRPSTQPASSSDHP
jgi:hypothetical protein